MKLLITAGAISIGVLLATKVSAQRMEDSLAIGAILQEEITSWNSGDAAAYSKHFSESGTFTNIRGMFFTGHKQFLNVHVDIFKGMFAKTVLQQEVTSFRFPGADVALVETLTQVSGFSKESAPKGVYIDSLGRLHTRLLQVFHKESGDWKIVAYHNVDLKSNAPVPGQE